MKARERNPCVRESAREHVNTSTSGELLRDAVKFALNNGNALHTQLGNAMPWHLGAGTRTLGLRV